MVHSGKGKLGREKWLLMLTHMFGSCASQAPAHKGQAVPVSEEIVQTVGRRIRSQTGIMGKVASN